MENEVDPVCSTHLDSNNTLFTIWHKGERYRFCSRECREEFIHKPKKYVKGWWGRLWDGIDKAAQSNCDCGGMHHH